MARRLQTLAGGKVLAVLEGGYNLEATALAAEATVRTLLGESLPLICSNSKNTPQDLISKIFVTPSNLNDINKALEIWSEYWPNLRSNQGLVDFEKSATRCTSLRSMIAGPSLKYPLSAYHFTPDTFTKPISAEELAQTKTFHESNSKLCPKLIEIRPSSQPDIYMAIMENLHTNKDHRIVANLILHRINFDKEIEDAENDYSEMGQSAFQLKWAPKEIITTTPMKLMYFISFI